MARELKNLLISNIHDRELARCGAEYLRGRLIDIGCGTKPYAKMLAPFVSEHVGVDHEGTLHNKSNIDIFGTAYEIPVDDASFDSAVCTAVLEHLEEPELALKECFRVLKPGAYAVYSVPFIWHLHEEPRDFYRFSPFGLKYLFEKTGFEVVELKALAGFWITFGQMFIYYLYRFNRGPIKWLRIIEALSLLIQGIACVFDKIDRAGNWSWMHLVVVRKTTNGGELCRESSA